MVLAAKFLQVIMGDRKTLCRNPTWPQPFGQFRHGTQDKYPSSANAIHSRPETCDFLCTTLGQTGLIGRRHERHWGSGL